MLSVKRVCTQSQSMWNVERLEPRLRIVFVVFFLNTIFSDWWKSVNYGKIYM